MYSFFFFKQKTAYEMRISDWSSDVCSSDLDLGDYLGATIGDDLLAVEIGHDQLNLLIARDAVVKVLTLLRDDHNCQFKQLVDLTAVDRPDESERDRKSVV